MAALPPWPYPAAATETRVRIHGKESITIRDKPCSSLRIHGKPCSSLRIHGKLVLSHGARRPGSPSVDVTHQAVLELDHRTEITRTSKLTRVDGCRDLIHATLAAAPATREFDLAAAGNWAGSARAPRDVARNILCHLCHDYDDGLPAAGIEVDVFLPELRVTLVYSEPKALLLACKAATDAAAGALPRGQCPICLLDMGTQNKETIRLPCSHAFHNGCITTWFDRASTCPTCRRDILEMKSEGLVQWSPKRTIHSF